VYRSIDADSVVSTVTQLRLRVEERFPGSGLSHVAHELEAIATTSAARALATKRPLVWLRGTIGLLVAVMLAGLAGLVWPLLSRPPTEPLSVLDWVQAIESGVNDLVFVAIAIYFLASMEQRVKRARVLSALHELRSLAHIIDMHQLTKDPERALLKGPDTKSSPTRELDPFALGRYLDYCSEMLSLLGKIAALYAQYTSDTAALSAVDQIEDLTSGLTRKIWQKIMLLHQLAKDTAGFGPRDEP
jgi:hypothetical protein